MSSTYRSRRFDSDLFYVWAVAIVIVLSFLYMACAGALVSESKARNAAADLGYTNVTVVNKAIFFVELRGCGKSDSARFTVRGTNPNGEVRTFYVCASILKGGTVRSR